MKGSKGVEHYSLGGKTYTVDLQAKIGAGSEGMVIAHPRDPSLCVKLFHPEDPGDPSTARIAAYRAKKVRAICNSGLSLPPQFTLPVSPVFDSAQTRIVGYLMKRVPPDYHKLIKLLDGSFRTSHQVGLKMIAELYADIFDDLEIIHGKGLVIGDVNPGCFMFQPGGSRAWVDTDSWGYKGYPCLATTEMFAHPDLYPNLLASGTVPPLPHHDRFAFLVAFTMMALPGAHPFRMGKHPRVQGLQNRANAGITIFDSDVTVPAMLGAFEVLSDEVLNAIVERLKQRTSAPLDPMLLRNFAENVVGCSKCGAEYHSSRRHCPQCREITMVQVSKLVSLLIEELFSVNGSLLFAQFIEENLHLVCRIGSKVQVFQIDGGGTTTILSPSLPSIPGARYRFFKDCLVVCPEPNKPAPAVLEIYRIEGKALRKLDSTSTGVLEGESAVFDTSARFLYRIAGNALVRSELFGPRGTMFDTPVGEVHQHQSWFTVDHSSGANREVIFGFDRALRNWQWFIIHGNAQDDRYQYSAVDDLGLHTKETVDDFAVYFSASSVLVVMRTFHKGRDFVRYAVIGLDGKVHINRTVDSTHATYPYWENLRGKLHQGKSVLHVTPNGIVKQDFSTEECTLLDDTTGRVTLDDRLVRLKGRVGIVRRQGVLTMRPKGSK